MSFKPYTTLVPPGITWFKDLEDFGRKSKGGALETIPGDSKRPYRPWADTTVVNQTQDYFTDFYSKPSTTRKYLFIKRDLAGYPILTPIGSPDFYKTYSPEGGTLNPPNVRTYNQFNYMFTGGVPFLEEKSLYTDLDKLGEPNFLGYQPGYDYPILLKPDDMLVVQNGDVKVINCYDFAKLVSVRDVPASEKLKLVQSVLNRTDLSDENKVKAVNDITIRSNVPSVVI